MAVGMTRLLAVLQLRNEEPYLPGCLAHLREHVDGIVALDDGSTDSTPEILARDPAVNVITKPVAVDHRWDELGNKRALLERARGLGADWVLACDADERLERRFLVQLRTLTSQLDGLRIAIWCRELWDRPDTYRVDGVWGSGNKLRTRLFPVPPVISYDQTTALHGGWEPDLARRLPRRTLDYNFYHLKMIRRADRIARRDFYTQLDPESKLQAIGYEYLADETGLELRTIAVDREYDYATLPPDLRRLLERNH
ncbi:MAG TPA: glycosyltransferase family 2 protein [Kofleriaceae bacterium]